MVKVSHREAIRMLESEGREGRCRLEKIKAPNKVTFFCELLPLAPTPLVRQIICSMLSSAGDPAALPYLLTVLHDSDEGVVAAADDAIANAGYEHTIDPLLRDEIGARLLALSSDLSSTMAIRTAAIHALGLLRFAPAAPFLRISLEDPAPEIRCVASEAVAHVKDITAVPLLQSRLRTENDKRTRAYLETALLILTQPEH